MCFQICADAGSTTVQTMSTKMADTKQANQVRMESLRERIAEPEGLGWTRTDRPQNPENEAGIVAIHGPASQRESVLALATNPRELR